MRLSAVTSAAGVTRQTVFHAFCFASDAVGNAVYVFANKVGNLYQVETVDVTDVTKMPAVGVIISKSDAAHCIVRTVGVIEGLYTGLLPGKRLLVQDDGKLNHGYNRPLSGVKLVQPMGVAISAQDVSLITESPVIILPV